MLSVPAERALAARLSVPWTWLGTLYRGVERRFCGVLEAELELLGDGSASAGGERPLGAPALTARAEALMYRGDARGAADAAQQACKLWPLCPGAMATLVVALTALNERNEVYVLAHELVERYPGRAASWLAVGAYEHLLGRYDEARHFFSRAVELDRQFPSAWLAVAHTYGCQDEADQAMAAYRAVERLFPGAHEAALCIGREYLSSGSLVLAKRFLSRALDSNPHDPLVHHEIGVAEYRQENWAAAAESFRKALRIVEVTNEAAQPGVATDKQHVARMWEPTVFNLGHAYRKLARYAEALEHYEWALLLAPDDPSIYTALGFTLALLGKHERAVDAFNKALIFDPESSIVADLLQRSLVSLFSSSDAQHSFMNDA